MVDLSMSELMAERLYNLLREGRMGKISFIQNFVSLSRREDKFGIMYLTWLLSRNKKNKYINDLLNEAIDNV